MFIIADKAILVLPSTPYLHPFLCFFCQELQVQRDEFVVYYKKFPVPEALSCT